MLTTTLLLTVFPFAMIYSAMTDLLEMKIENRAMIVLAAASQRLRPPARLGEPYRRGEGR